MNKPKNNVLWITLGAAGILLPAFFFLFVLSAWNEQNAQERNIQGLLRRIGTSGTIPGKPDIDKWTEQRRELLANYDRIIKFYEDYDNHLESWLTGAKPTQGDFINSYLQAPSLFLDKFRRDPKDTSKPGLGFPIKEGDEDKEPANPGNVLFGFTWEEPTEQYTKQLTLEERDILIKILEKRYWIRDRIAAICTEKGLNIDRLLDVYFPLKLSEYRVSENNDSFKRAFAGGVKWENRPQAMEVSYPGDPTRGASVGMTAFREYVLPDALGNPDGREYLGETITFGVTLDILGSDITKFLAELIRPDWKGTGVSCCAPGGPRGEHHPMPLLVELLGVRIHVREANPAIEEQEIRYRTPAERDEKQKAIEEEFRKKPLVRPVRLAVMAQAIDLDPSKRAKLQ